MLSNEETELAKKLFEQTSKTCCLDLSNLREQLSKYSVEQLNVVTQALSDEFAYRLKMASDKYGELLETQD